MAQVQVRRNKGDDLIFLARRHGLSLSLLTVVAAAASPSKQEQTLYLYAQ